ncbi:exodeoxyribonuclease VII large subunit [Blastopirellula marina]|uniref:Exodeoxyribonuclease 7 large subunit n=1 Tax=Blastopirellula marina TaxID=124 RepID=A0A2S8G969_9BACT|nr:exodeoxyribonuclease VII large subunit [Blastopirellula marina]PQO40969.1 exodeoxyribonuclease VII large subunit [Blastopirellula marina]PTL45852.1 exodeoxyribonuclease VII large subunit [Blastopirellula marina]
MDAELEDWPAPGDKPPVLSVSQLTALIQGTLEMAIPAVWVAGEISNLSQPRSGHVYLTLKDDEAQIRAVIWRNTAAKLPFDLEDGQEVLCHGQLDVYPPRGSYQLVIREIEPRGVGSLQLKLRQLQQKLSAEGLFDADRKRPIPKFPRRIAFVTSPTGAAVRDFLEVMNRRWKNVEVLVIPARVQGDGAAQEIAAGIRLANQLAQRPDVLVVGRGGGSMEDLWCFNEEVVVRAIAASEIPTISAVGHEIDVTLADFAADVRALTPSEAAELAVPAMAEIQERLSTFQQRLATGLRSTYERAAAKLELLSRNRIFTHPFEMVHDYQHALDELDAAATRAIRRRLQNAQEALARRSAQLEAMSPLAVLARGYSVTRNSEQEVIRTTSQVQVGDEIETILPHGRIHSRVESIEPNES